MRSRPIALVSAVLATLTLVLSGCTGKDAVGGSGNGYRYVGGTKLGKTFPQSQRKAADDFTATLLNGGTFSLSQDAGKVVVINFWATWCGPCTTETPQFDSVYRAYKDKGVAFVGVDTKDSPEDAPRAFVRDNHISYPIVYDEQGETAVRLGNIPDSGLPFTVLVDRHGLVAGVYQTSMAPKDLEPLLDALLAET